MAAAKPDVGDILVVIHDFQARSSDELTLAKGDRVELLERDDEFGDGWFLGKHMVSGNTGLFPEVYTRPAPKGFPTGASALAAAKQMPLPDASSMDQQPSPYAATTDRYSTNQMSLEAHSAMAAPVDEPREVTPPSTAVSSNSVRHSMDMLGSPTTPTASIPITPQPPLSVPMGSSMPSPFNQTPPSLSVSSGYSGRIASGHDSTVLHETLNVIDEHITDLRSPTASSRSHLHAPTDSGSEYSSNIDHRMSYIQGEETDEEEDGYHTRAEVESWTPDDVAEYLFTVGVEKRHCEVFRDQEISGEVLLGMDQASLFIAAFELGPVGRRLKTWQKIKALQDEVGGSGSSMSNRRRSTHGSDVASEDARRSNRSRTNTLTSNNGPIIQQRLPPIDDRPTSLHSKRLSLGQAPRLDTTQPLSPMTARGGFLDNASPLSPRRSVVHEKRPSAASVRDLHHSRRHSSTDYRTSIASSIAPRLASTGTFPQQDTLHLNTKQEPSPIQQHKKHPSFDRNWTLGSATASPQVSSTPQFAARPLSSAGLQDALANQGMGPTFHNGLNESVDLDRGYFSGPDMDNKRKSFLQKKNRESLLKGARAAMGGTSYAEEQRVRSATALSRHSHFGSVDSVRDPNSMVSAAQKYHGIANGGGTAPHRRTASTNTANTVNTTATNDSARMRPALPPKDVMSPTVTKLDGKSQPSPASPASPAVSRQGIHGEWFSGKPGFKAAGFGLRALSDAVSGHDRSKLASPASHTDSFPKDSPLQSPARTGSTTPSGGPSFELDSPDPRSPSTGATMTSARNSSNTARKKGKKETSAYQRGLLKVSPREAMQDADYSGWMKKKSSNLMATWKPRLFVLKGRRLAYYYSEDDEEEKGLIDISFHRVLPADNERLTGLHATLTGASATPTMPANSNMPTLASTDADNEPESSLKAGAASDSIFIFKLVPPRAGLSRAVNFTKPTVHYFAVPNVKQGRLWMASLMKATIDRDDTVAITTTYQQKTISLTKARQMRHRPPALMNLDEKLEADRRNEAEAEAAAAAAAEGYDETSVLDEEERRMLAAAMAQTTQPTTEKPANGLGILFDKNGTATGPSATVPTVAAPVSSDNHLQPGPATLPYRAESARARQFIFEPEKDDDRQPLSA